MHNTHSYIVDLVEPLPITENGKKYILTVMCDLTKFFISVPIPNKEAITVAKVIVRNEFSVFEHFKVIRTDQGT